MKTTKAVITAAGQRQRNLPLQTLIDRDGTEKSVLCIIIEEVLTAGIREIGVVVHPGDETAYAEVAGDHAGRLYFVPQPEPLGYGHAIYCARDFVGRDPFLHLVSDHLYISRSDRSCAQKVVAAAEAEACAVSAVQPTRENLLPYFGAVGGQRVPGKPGIYRIDKVLEKPTPTEAEQQLIVPGLRAGHYLCFFGTHVLTPTVMDILAHKIETKGDGTGFALSHALAELPQHEQYLAFERGDWRYDIGARYGLLNAQLALALNGEDREEVLASMLELLASREMGRV